MQYVTSTLYTISEHGVSSITTTDAHTSAGKYSTELTPRPPADLNGLIRFARKTNSGFCACAIIFQLAYTSNKQKFGTLHLKCDDTVTHGRGIEGGNRRMDWLDNTVHTTS